jgi:uncharacterized membrane protein
MRKIGKLFIQGLVAILPVALTIYILYWLAVSAESILGSFIKFFIEDLYVPGMGVVVGFLIIVGVGVLLRLWIFHKIFELGEKILQKLPLVKSLYGSIRDLMNLFDTSKKKEFSKVVMVTFANKDTQLIGLVTREDLSNLPDGIDNDQTIAVYLPMSYQMGGFTVFVPKTNVKPVDMSIEEAMRFALTAAVSTGKRNSN